MTSSPLPPGLYVAATPIGNLGDVSERLRNVLGSADVVLCEDTRVTGKLLKSIGVSARLARYDDHAGADVRPKILGQLADGAVIVLVSDAGTPLIADPGFKLVREARAQGTPVRAVPGPSALTAALSIAGVPTDRFSFLGFMPAKSAARRRVLEDVAGRSETLVFYDTGPRLAASLLDIAASLAPETVVIARELTKAFEEVIEDTPAALISRYEDAPPKGEIVLIIPPRSPAEVSLEDADPLMAEAMANLSLKDAATKVAAETGLKKRDLYQRWLNRAG